VLDGIIDVSASHVTAVRSTFGYGECRTERALLRSIAAMCNPCLHFLHRGHALQAVPLAGPSTS